MTISRRFPGDSLETGKELVVRCHEAAITGNKNCCYFEDTIRVLEQEICEPMTLRVVDQVASR